MQLSGYSRFIGWMRLLLPLAALVLLSMVFLLARAVDPERALSEAPIDVEERARDPRISGVRFAGMTDDGAALRLVTETARSDPQAVLRFEVTGLEVSLEGQSGEGFLARAESGALDRGAGTFEMDGGVHIEASPGYRLMTASVNGALDRTLIEVPGTLSGAAPAGLIEAGHMRIRSQPGDESRYSLVFGGGVRLVYMPEQ